MSLHTPANVSCQTFRLPPSLEEVLQIGMDAADERELSNRPMKTTRPIPSEFDPMTTEMEVSLKPPIRWITPVEIDDEDNYCAIQYGNVSIINSRSSWNLKELSMQSFQDFDRLKPVLFKGTIDQITNQISCFTYLRNRPIIELGVYNAAMSVLVDIVFKRGTDTYAAFIKEPKIPAQTLDSIKNHDSVDSAITFAGACILFNSMSRMSDKDEVAGFDTGLAALTEYDDQDMYRLWLGLRNVIDTLMEQKEWPLVYSAKIREYLNDTLDYLDPRIYMPRCLSLGQSQPFGDIFEDEEEDEEDAEMEE